MRCVTSVVILLLGLLPRAGSEARASEPFTLSLLTRNSLDGWEYGAQPSVGWSNTDGRLSGDERATPLLAGWTLGPQFDLTFHWQVQPGSALRISFPCLEANGRLDLRIAEGDSCGALFHDNKLLSAGGNVPASETGHQSTLRRQRDSWQLFVDGQLVAKATIPAETRLGLTLAVAEGAASVANVRLDEPVGRPIFNGVDLTGWWSPRGLKSWPVVDGEITCLNRSGDYLRTEQEFANFTFSCEYKMRRGGNSGIGIRTARNAWPSGDGIELQLLDEPLTAPLTRSSTMGLYGNVGPLARADHSEDWNRLVVKAEGYLITAWVNGELVQHVNTARLPELKYRPLSGWIGIQDHGAWIRVRNLNVLPGPEGLGPSAWYAQRPLDGSQLVLERLMNSERLATPDGVRAAALARPMTGDQEQVLAELSGPGAVVQLDVPASAGELAFYFDGEREPRLVCPAEKLAAHLPEVARSGNSVATFLAYERRLKIVARNGQPGEARLEYVSFGGGVPLVSFRDREESIARGMLPAISYRIHQMESGRVRDDDPAPRHVAAPERIEPGATRELVRVEGTGTVQWWRLNAPRSALDNDDLWLEFTVDGEPEPAIAAPARYLFPGMKANRGYLNFVVANYEGLVNRLAIPYSQGLTVVARNRGSAALPGIGFALSVDPHGSGQPERFRLRGVYQSASEPGAVLSRSGQGRLVALVCDASASTSGAVELAVDGAAQEPATTLARWLGLPDTQDELRAPFQGRHAGLVWRYFLLAPPEFEHSIALQAKEGMTPGGRLALCYHAK